LDRAWGRPLQQIEVGPEGAFSEMSDEQIAAFISEASKELEHLSVAGHA
jgi:hypothetical protein